MPTWLQIAVAVVTLPAALFGWYEIYQKIRSGRNAKNAELEARRAADLRIDFQGIDKAMYLAKITNNGSVAEARDVELLVDGVPHASSLTIDPTPIGNVAPGETVSRQFFLALKHPCPSLFEVVWDDDSGARRKARKRFDYNTVCGIRF